MTTTALHRLCVLCVLAALLASCAASPSADISDPGSGRFLHVVLFWFEEDAEPELVDELAQLYATKVRAVPGVEQVYFGRPAGTPRALRTMDDAGAKSTDWMMALGG